MIPRSKLALPRARVLTLLVSLSASSLMALANLSSEPLTVDLLSTNTVERAYGWPLAWYWRIASCVPATVQLYDPWPLTPLRLEWPVSRYDASSMIADLAIWLVLLAVVSIACESVLRLTAFACNGGHELRHSSS